MGCVVSTVWLDFHTMGNSVAAAVGWYFSTNYSILLSFPLSLLFSFTRVAGESLTGSTAMAGWAALNWGRPGSLTDRSGCMGECD